MSAKKDLKGQRFGRLTVLWEIGPKEGGGGIEWACRCDCGNMKAATTKQLNAGQIKSCGCLSRDLWMTQGWKNSNKQLCDTYNNIRAVCCNPGNPRYGDFGGAGIKMCEEWKNDFYAFWKWSLAHGYHPKTHLHRRDQNGDFTPENCYWRPVN